MNRKTFTVPRVFLTGYDPGPQPGSLTGEPEVLRPFPMSFEEWLQSRWMGDYDQTGDIDFNDYARWWATNNLGIDVWTQYNADVAWNDEWNA